MAVQRRGILCRLIAGDAFLECPRGESFNHGHLNGNGLAVPVLSTELWNWLSSVLAALVGLGMAYTNLGRLAGLIEIRMTHETFLVVGHVVGIRRCIW